MTTTKVLSATALVFLFATATCARARQEHQEPQHQEKEQPKGQEHQQAAKPEHQQPQQHPQAQAKPQQQPQAKAQQQHTQQEAKAQPTVQHQEQARNPSNAQHQQQTVANHPPQRSQQDVARQHSQPALRLSARGNGRIPDDRFHQNFGNEHRFRIGAPVMVGGYSRFQYGGYSFGFVQPWPVGWYYTDDVYVDYVDGGYYMYNPYHPGARVAISVVL